MRCPKCHNNSSKVLDSRPGSSKVRRRRECERCGYRFSTVEEVFIFDLYVQKRNGSAVLFNNEKLEFGIRKAFNKRRIDEEKIRDLNKMVVENILALDKEVIKSETIGNIVLKNLKDIDEAAYICFWAMFGNFESVTDFNKLLKEFSN